MSFIKLHHAWEHSQVGTCSPHIRAQERPLRKPRRTAEKIFPQVERYHQSGQTRNAFCAAHRLSASQLYHWQGKYPRKVAASQGAAFLKVSAPAADERVVTEVWSTPQGRLPHTHGGWEERGREAPLYPCARHGQQLGGESPLSSQMTAKD